MVDFVLRPCCEKDLKSLTGCIEKSTYGLTSLPKESALLKKKIEHSLASFTKAVETPDDESYLFVLEDLQSRKVVGTSGIISTTGIDKPFYSFKIHKSMHACPSLQIYKEHELLYLSQVKKGPTEICALFLDPEYRKHGLSKLLSFPRFLFMNQNRQRFHPVIVAEMRGVIDERGHSAFYEYVCAPFFGLSFIEANLLRMKDETFIYDLMPKEPIYLNLLAKEAQEVCGKTHKNTQPAYKLLTQQGFSFHGEIDIFDGGPDIYGTLNELQLIKESKTVPLKGTKKEIEEGSIYLLSNNKIQFRACYGKILTEENGIIIEEGAQRALEIKDNEPITYVLK